VHVRERGARTRRTRSDETDGWLDAPQGPGGSSRFWPALAIIAIIVATAGWTTVIVTHLNDTGSSAPQPTATDNSTPAPVAPSHVFPDLEALLPTSVNGTSLSIESWTGDAIFGSDPWSQSLTTYLATVQKGPADVHVAQAYDAVGTLDIGAAAYQVDGITATALRDAMVAAWKVQYPNLVTSQATVGGKTVLKGVFGNGLPDSYWYESGNVVFDVETTDAALATTVLTGLPTGGLPSSSPSPASSGAPSPAPSGSPAHSPSPTPSPS
jgi:hypothetical protein